MTSQAALMVASPSFRLLMPKNLRARARRQTAKALNWDSIGHGIKIGNADIDLSRYPCYAWRKGTSSTAEVSSSQSWISRPEGF